MAAQIADASKRFELLVPKKKAEYDLYGAVAGYLIASHSSKPEYPALLDEFFTTLFDENTKPQALKEAIKVLGDVLNDKLAASRGTKNTKKGANYIRVDGDYDEDLDRDEDEVAAAAKNAPSGKKSAKSSGAPESDEDENEDVVEDEAMIKARIAAEALREKEEREKEKALEEARRKAEEEREANRQQLESKKRQVESTFDPNLVLKRDDDDGFFVAKKKGGKGGRK